MLQKNRSSTGEKLQESPLYEEFNKVEYLLWVYLSLFLSLILYLSSSLWDQSQRERVSRKDHPRSAPRQVHHPRSAPRQVRHPRSAPRQVRELRKHDNLVIRSNKLGFLFKYRARVQVAVGLSSQSCG